MVTWSLASRWCIDICNSFWLIAKAVKQAIVFFFNVQDVLSLQLHNSELLAFPGRRSERRRVATSQFSIASCQLKNSFITHFD